MKPDDLIPDHPKKILPQEIRDIKENKMTNPEEHPQKPDHLHPDYIKENKMEQKEIELFGGDSERRSENKMQDNEKLVRFRCAQSLFNISNDLRNIELMGSNVCLIIAKGLIAGVDLPEEAGSVHSDKTVHDSKVSEEVEAMSEKIREELNG